MIAVGVAMLGLCLPMMRASERAAWTVAAEARFEAVDVIVDSPDAPLATYQFEFMAPAGVSIVGVESGEHAAYREAPYYDAAALMGGRIIVGALGDGTDLPTGPTRVARLHLRIEGGAEPRYECVLRVAADADAKRIGNAAITVREGMMR